MTATNSPNGWTALLLPGEAEAGGTAPGFWTIAGVPIIERQARAARLAGATAVAVIADTLPEPMATRLRDAGPVYLLGAKGGASPWQLDALAGPIILIAPGLEIDARLVRALALAGDGQGPAIACFTGDAPPGAERIDRNSHWAGLVRTDQAMFRATLGNLGDWSLPSTIMRTAEGAGARRVAVHAIPLFDRTLRTDRPIVWHRPATPAAAKGCTANASHAHARPDRAARHVVAPLAGALARLLTGGPVSPSGLALVAILLLVAAPLLLVGGMLLAGFAALLLAPLIADTSAHLARARLEPTPRPAVTAGRLSAATAAALVALAVNLAWQGQSPLLVVIAALGAAAWSGVTALARLFEHRTGVPLYEATDADRWIAAVDHPSAGLAWPLAVFALSGRLVPAITAVALWACLLLACRLRALAQALDRLLPPPST